MKHTREIKVAVLGIICLFLLYFGFHFLKGVNIFSPTHTYTGLFSDLGGLTEQAPVYIRGYKVGQVNHIRYDFRRDSAFTVSITIDRHIGIPSGSEMILTSDGLLGGKAIEVSIPTGEPEAFLPSGASLPTSVKKGLTETLESELLAHIDDAVLRADSLIASLQEQTGGDHIRRTLANVDRISTDLTVSSRDLKQLTHDKLPIIVDSVQNTIDYANVFLANLKEADVKGAVAKIDTTVGQVSSLLASKEGTLGMLLHDKSLYQHADSAVMSVDSLVTDLKAHPKRYVHFSLFGRKEGKKQSQKK